MKNFNAFFKEFPLFLMGHIVARSKFVLFVTLLLSWCTMTDAFACISPLKQRVLINESSCSFVCAKEITLVLPLLLFNSFSLLPRGGRFSFLFEKIISLWMIIPIYQCAIITQLFNNIFLSHSWAAECRRY